MGRSLVKKHTKFQMYWWALIGNPPFTIYSIFIPSVLQYILMNASDTCCVGRLDPLLQIGYCLVQIRQGAVELEEEIRWVINESAFWVLCRLMS